MLTIGLDYHYLLSVICILDEHGKEQSYRSIKGTKDILVQELKKIKTPFRICFEASTGYGILYEELSALKRCKQVQVANPGKTRLIFNCKRKTDRIDAKKLATLQFLDQLPTVYVPGVDVRAWRGMINHRNRVVNECKSTKNGLRAFLRHRGISAPKSLWSKSGYAWLHELEFSIRLDTIQRDNFMMRLELADRMLRSIEQELNAIARRHPGVQLLQSIPGVGPRTAEAVMAYIDNPKRFSKVRSIGDYFGMVPSLDASAGKYRYGHITKEGPGVVRKMITEAAWQGIRRSDALRKRFTQYLRNDVQRKRIAIVAVGHFLLRVMLKMLKSNQTWEPAMV